MGGFGVLEILKICFMNDFGLFLLLGGVKYFDVRYANVFLTFFLSFWF